MCLIMEIRKDNHAMSSETNINWFTYEELEINKIVHEISPAVTTWIWPYHQTNISLEYLLPMLVTAENRKVISDVLWTK